MSSPGSDMKRSHQPKMEISGARLGLQHVAGFKLQREIQVFLFVSDFSSDLGWNFIKSLSEREM